MAGRTDKHNPTSDERGEGLMREIISPQRLIDSTKEMKSFLELVQPLPVKYGYSRGVVKDESTISYRNTASTPRLGIGNELISERVTFVVTIQTKTAEQNLIYSAMLKYGTYKSKVMFVAEDMRRDVTVESGWINTIILTAYNRTSVDDLRFTADEVYEILQDIADRYVMITSLYRDPYELSTIDKFVVPELEDRIYHYAEVLTLKHEYLDRFVLTITEY